MPHDGSGRLDPEPAAEPSADRSDHVVAVSEREAPRTSADAEGETADTGADTTTESPDPFSGTRSSRLKDALDQWWTETTESLTARADTTRP
ncbi:hypothetical protein [Salinigranum marinum]|uniref:hypothetical protein n=1 Tax=Salinigranum marinum TaxID=1515595 RepID=UPI002989B8E0|nr:hypothetical protein [Salinigranum marinum]